MQAFHKCWCLRSELSFLCQPLFRRCLRCLSENGVKCFRIQNLHGLTIFERCIVAAMLLLQLVDVGTAALLNADCRLFLLFFLCGCVARLDFTSASAIVCSRGLSIFAVCYKAGTGLAPGPRPLCLWTSACNISDR